MKKLILMIIISSSVNSSYAIGKWECVDRVVTCHTWRMWVPSGWVISGDITTGEPGYAMTFVPDINHEWKL